MLRRYYFVFDVVWSQTEKDTVIVKAEGRQGAELELAKRFKGYAYLEFVRKTQRFIRVPTRYPQET